MLEAQEGKGTDIALRGLNHIHGAEYVIAPNGLMRSLFLVPRLLTHDFVPFRNPYYHFFVLKLPSI